jgi:dienelactone hydrolase
VVVFYGSNVIAEPSSSEYLRFGPSGFRFLLESGRAVVCPVYLGTFERQSGLTSDRPNDSILYRDHVISWSKDLGKTIDYLELREEIDSEKIAYLGVSWGGAMGAVLPAVEDRVKVCVLHFAGFFQQSSRPEVEQLNFAPRVKVPVLMLNGRYDTPFPVHASQQPMFRMLGTPEENKRHYLFDSGHAIPGTARVAYTREWLDLHLGKPIN